MSEEIQLIIFDNDGVLIDSEIIWHQFFIAELARLGFTMTVEESFQLFSGINHQKSLEAILEEKLGLSGSELNFSKIGDETEASYPSLLKPVQNIQGVLDFIDSKNIQKCIASNGDFEYIKRTLEITGLKKYFDDENIFGVEDKALRKPDPYVFLQALNKFSVSPENCLIVEDHPLGIKAAKKAEIKAVGFLGASHARNEKHREWIIHSNPEIVINNSLELLDLFTKIRIFS